MRRNTIICLILAVVLVMFSSCLAMNEAKVRLAESTAVFDTEYDGEVIRDLRYGDAPRNVYDLYLPEDTAAAGASHLILFIHGGSWTSGDKEDESRTAGTSPPTAMWLHPSATRSRPRMRIRQSFRSTERSRRR